MLRSTTTRSSWLGAPVVGMDRRAFEALMLKRFPPPATEQAVGYIERVTDRQVSKAKGLLVFDAVLFVILGVAGPNTSMSSWAIFGSLALFVSSLSLLLLMYASWGATENYADAESDFRRSCANFYRGAYLLTIGIATTTLAMGIGAVTMLMRLQG